MPVETSSELPVPLDPSTVKLGAPVTPEESEQLPEQSGAPAPLDPKTVVLKGVDVGALTSRDPAEAAADESFDIDRTAADIDFTRDPKALDWLGAVAKIRHEAPITLSGAASDVGDAISGAVHAGGEFLSSIPRVVKNIGITGDVLARTAPVEAAARFLAGQRGTAIIPPSAVKSIAEIKASMDSAGTSIGNTIQNFTRKVEPTVMQIQGFDDGTRDLDWHKETILQRKALAEGQQAATEGHGATWLGVPEAASDVGDLAKQYGVQVDPQVVADLQWVTDPLNYLPAGAGFEAVTKAGQVVARAGTEQALKGFVAKAAEKLSAAGEALEARGAAVPKGPAAALGGILGGPKGAAAAAAIPKAAQVLGKGLQAAGDRLATAELPGWVSKAASSPVVEGIARGAVAPFNPEHLPGLVGVARIGMSDSPREAGEQIGSFATLGGLAGGAHGLPATARDITHAAVAKTLFRAAEREPTAPITYGRDAGLDSAHATAMESLRADGNEGAANTIDFVRARALPPGTELYTLRPDEYHAAVADAQGVDPATSDFRGTPGFVHELPDGTHRIYLNSISTALGHEAGHAIIGAMDAKIRSDFFQAITDAYGDKIPEFARNYDARLSRATGVPSERYISGRPAAVVEEIGAEILSAVIHSDKLDGLPPDLRHQALAGLGRLAEASGLYRPDVNLPPGESGRTALGIRPSIEAAEIGRQAVRDVAAGNTPAEGAVPPVEPAENPATPAASSPAPAPTPLDPKTVKLGPPVEAPAPRADLAVQPDPELFRHEATPPLSHPEIDKPNSQPGRGGLLTEPPDELRTPSIPIVRRPVEPLKPAEPVPVEPRSEPTHSVRTEDFPVEPKPTAPEKPRSRSARATESRQNDFSAQPPAPVGAEVPGAVAARRQMEVQGYGPDAHNAFEAINRHLQQPQGEVGPVRADYSSVVDDAGASAGRSAERKSDQTAAYELERDAALAGMDAHTREQVEKAFVPNRWTVESNGHVTLQALSLDKVIANANKVARAGRNTGMIPYDVRRGNFTAKGWSSLVSDIGVYTRNQSNGYAGDGSPIRIPEGYEGVIPKRNTEYSPAKLSRAKSDFINLLMNVAPPETGKAGKGFADIPVAKWTNPQAAQLAEANGRLPIRPASISRPGETMRGGTQIAEMNPLREQFAKLGIRFNERDEVNGLFPVTERLRLDKIRNVEPIVGSNFRAPSTDAVRAGFMPGSESGKRSRHEEATELAALVGGTVVGSAARAGGAPRDIDIRVTESQVPEALKKLEARGYEQEGSSVVSPEESKKLGKDFGPGWARNWVLSGGPAGRVELWHTDEGRLVPEPGGKARAGFMPATTEVGKALESDGYEFSESARDSDFSRGEKIASVSLDRQGERIGQILYSHKGDAGKILNVGITEGFRQLGLGETLYREALARLQKDGVRTLSGDIVDPKARPQRIRQKLLGDPVDTVADPRGASSVRSRIDPDAKFMPDVSKAPKPNEDVRAVAEQYGERAGIPRRGDTRYEPLNEARGHALADAYEASKNEPANPAVKAAYRALVDETVAQWHAIADAGYELTPWTGEGQPYANSAEMAADVAQNKRLHFFLTEGGFGSDASGKSAEHPMLEPTDIVAGGKHLLANDAFRAVHDFFGHAAEGYQFGPRGEYNAYLAHAKMFSDEAVRALATETLAQNSWVNFGKHLRDEAGNIAARGVAGHVPPPERPFADQKAFLLPDETIAGSTPGFDGKASFSPTSDGGERSADRAGTPADMRDRSEREGYKWVGPADPGAVRNLRSGEPVDMVVWHNTTKQNAESLAASPVIGRVHSVSDTYAGEGFPNLRLGSYFTNVKDPQYAKARGETGAAVPFRVRLKNPLVIHDARSEYGVSLDGNYGPDMRPPTVYQMRESVGRIAKAVEEGGHDGIVSVEHATSTKGGKVVPTEWWVVLPEANKTSAKLLRDTGVPASERMDFSKPDIRFSPGVASGEWEAAQTTEVPISRKPNQSFMPTGAEWEARKAEREAEKSRPVEIPTSKRKTGRGGKAEPVARLTPTGWIRPDGTYDGIGADARGVYANEGDFHESSLRRNAEELRSKFRLEKPERQAAIDRGFVRVRLNGQTGRLGVEAVSDKLNSRTRATIQRVVEDNAGRIDRVDINLLNARGRIVGGGSESLVGKSAEEKLGAVSDLLSARDRAGFMPYAGTTGGTRGGARVADLETAQGLEKAGRSPEEIRGGTGWFRGPVDGKWRVEIPDEHAGFTEAVDRRNNGPGQPLRDVFLHPDLYQAYPDLEEVPVRFRDLPPGSHGFFDSGSKKITLNSLDSAEQHRDTVLHEIQHWIQDREGLSAGSSPEEWYHQDSETTGYTPAEQTLLDQVERELEETRKREKEISGIWSAMPDSEKGVGKNTNLAREGNYVEARIRNLTDSRAILYRQARSRQARGNYSRTAGEVEAREVSARSKFDIVARKATPPYSTQNVPVSEMLRAPGDGQFSPGAEPPTRATVDRSKLDERQAADVDMRVSTRMPNGVRATENGDTADLRVDTASFLKHAPDLPAVARAIRKYPGFSDIRGDARSTIEQFQDRVKENLLYVYDHVPQEVRDISKLWYKGGRRIAEESANAHGVSTAQSAGVLAALSPQRPWQDNVKLSDLVHEAHSKLRDTKTHPEQLAWIRDNEIHRVLNLDEDGREAAPKDAAEAADREAKAKSLREIADRIEGKTYGELRDVYDKAAWVRSYFDGFRKDKTTPDINPQGDRLHDSPVPRKLGWPPYATVAAALSILENGDRKNISDNLGGAHKVRNFYNNLLLPDVGEFGDVTVDTHAIAAGHFRALGGTSPEVAHGLGGIVSAKNGGLKGLYALYADAYRQAAAERGILPRELQSITWEAWRDTFNASFKKQKANLAAIAADFAATTNEEQRNAARERAIERAGGWQKPSWWGLGPGVGAPEIRRATGNVGELSPSEFSARPDPRAGLGELPISARSRP